VVDEVISQHRGLHLHLLNWSWRKELRVLNVHQTGSQVLNEKLDGFDSYMMDHIRSSNGDFRMNDVLPV